MQRRIDSPKRNTIYLAGKMRGVALFGFPAFDAARNKWQDRGWKVINPADLDRQAGFSEYAKPGEVESDFVRKAMCRDTTAICQLCDAVAMLKGWETSKGARAEKALAEALDLPVYCAETFELLEGNDA